MPLRWKHRLELLFSKKTVQLARNTVKHKNQDHLQDRYPNI